MKAKSLQSVERFLFRCCLADPPALYAI